MTEQISQRELRNDGGWIMRGLDQGRTCVVTRRSEPVGELRPFRRRRLVDAGIVIEAFRGRPAVDSTRFRDDVNHMVDQRTDPCA